MLRRSRRLAAAPSLPLLLASVLLLLASSIGSAAASPQQQQAATNPSTPATQAPAAKCFQLTATRACPSYVGAWAFATAQYNDTAGFDRFLMSRFTNYTGYIDQFRAGYGCPRFDGTGTRYHITLLCSLLVDAAWNTCTNNAPPPAGFELMCKDTCMQTTAALTGLFTNTSVCDAQPAAAATLQSRQATLNSFSQFCARLPVANQQSGRCLDGSLQPTDAATCGFISLQEGISYCQSGSTDPCCSRVLSNKAGTLGKGITGVVDTDDKDKQSTLNNGNTSASSASSSKGFFASKQNILIVVLGSLAGVAIVAAGSVFAVVTARKNRNTTSHTNMLKSGGSSKGQGQRNTLDYSAPMSSPQLGMPGSKPLSSSAASSLRSTPSPTPPSPMGSFKNMLYSRDSIMAPPAAASGNYSANAHAMPSAAAGRRPSNAGSKAGSIEREVVAAMRTSSYSNSNGSLINGMDNGAAGNRGQAGASKSDSYLVSPGAMNNRTSAFTLGSFSVGSPLSPGEMGRDTLSPSAVIARMRVTATYAPNMDDELRLMIGDTVEVYETYDDGWGRGRVVRTGQEGVFPVACAVPTNN
ncbi:hypothetical protein BC831DRAFT_444365 [Entophlyctis helioformis]|nr:hypothetical protein BC831DRAFT_444365 [Entophlyctis helioformis]